MKVCSYLLSLFALLATSSVAVGEVPAKVKFKKVRIDSQFRSEGVAVGDFNGDGKLDIAAGSVYFAAPDWKMVPLVENPPVFDPKGYAPTFANFAEDLNGDGWTDLIVVDFPGKQTWWLENPQSTGGPWKRHEMVAVTNNESPQYVDINGDGKRELIAGTSPDPEQTDGPDRYMAFFSRTNDPYASWKINRVSQAGAPSTTRYSHGLGVGDINGDGRRDIVVPQGWWEQPADDTAPWKFHPAPLGEPAADMHVFDINGDGRADVLSSSAHAYGIWWHEQTADGWKTHLIDDSFSQTHSVCVADINGDGLLDFVTGKRWWAHAQGDPGGDEPAVLFWFEQSRKDGQVVWIPHQIDHDSGVGTQFQLADINGDGLVDIISSNKKGTHLFLQTRATE